MSSENGFYTAIRYLEYAGLKKGTSYKRTLNRAVDIGLLSKSQLLIPVNRSYFGYAFSHGFKGYYFNGNVKEVDFVFDMDKKLYALSFVFSPDLFLETSKEDFFESIYKKIDDEIGPFSTEFVKFEETYFGVCMFVSLRKFPYNVIEQIKQMRDSIKKHHP